MNDVAYVTQEMWNRSQDALRAALPVLEEHTPPLSTAGTMVSLREQVRQAINGGLIESESERKKRSALEYARVLLRFYHGDPIPAGSARREHLARLLDELLPPADDSAINGSENSRG